jgi:hypothetical protein
MRKILISIAVLVVTTVLVVVIVLAVHKSRINKTDSDIATIAKPDIIATQSARLCFYGASKTSSGLSDVSLAVLNIEDNKVTGMFKYLPAEKDSKIGSFSGVVGPVDKMAMARTADVTWNVSAEGMEAKEQLRIMFGEGTAQAGFGEMVQGPDDIWNYKDVTKITYGQTMTDVSCDDVRIIAHADGRMCYSYHQEGTNDAPAAVDEYIDITAINTLVKGIKKGYPKGPDMWDPYRGTVSGSRSGDIIHLLFNYTVEGSKGAEAETYQYVAGGIQKLRYPLIDKKGVLTPDITKPFSTIDYKTVDCSTVPQP